ncbi:MAG: carboxypeptidase regulatory-like domain-containing protein [Planctomycetaceae bacterium]|nr:carboxypeptidase regulatory-like domain-containing protein [Planctomycetaceae bacterium]
MKMEKGLCCPPRLVSMTAMACLLIVGCTRGARVPENEQPVVPVSGTVHVNGEPLANVKLEFHTKNPTGNGLHPRATTDAEGKFQAWTYRKDDGLIAGEYTITFLDHSHVVPYQRASDAGELFKGKYANPEKSEFTVTVPESGESVDMGLIELTR